MCIFKTDFLLARAVGRIQISRLKLFPRFMSLDASEFQKCVQINASGLYSVLYDRIQHKNTNVRRRLTQIF